MRGGAMLRILYTTVCAALVAVSAPAAARELGATERAQLAEVANQVLDRYIDAAYVPVFVQVQRAEWSSTKQEYTEAMAERDRRLALRFAALGLISHSAVEKGIVLARRAEGGSASADPRIELARMLEGSEAALGGLIVSMGQRVPIDRRHAGFVAELERRHARHPAFREAVNAKPDIPAESCKAGEIGTPRYQEFRIRTPADYERYRAAYSNVDLNSPRVMEDLVPLIAFAPCLARHEIEKLGDVRAGLRTLAVAIDVGSRLRLPPVSSMKHAESMRQQIFGALDGLAAYLGWLGAGMP